MQILDPDPAVINSTTKIVPNKNYFKNVVYIFQKLLQTLEIKIFHKFIACASRKKDNKFFYMHPKPGSESGSTCNKTLDPERH